MGNQKYTDETKAAVMAALLEGQSVSLVANQYKIPEGTVKAWKSRTITNGGGVATVTTEKRERVGELLVELVITEIETLIEISKAVRDRAWIGKQSAADLAVLSGVKHDKLMRVLDAFGDDSPAED